MAELAGYAPVRIRVGVTGHRTLPDEVAISGKVDDVLQAFQRRLPSTSSTPVLYEVVSPLGEGADRIVAERALRIPGAILEAPLPLPREEYERDFGSEASRARFRNLLDRADRDWVVGGSDRNDAYRRAGTYVVDSCDVLIAIWDGRPSRGTGGTSDILDLARRRGMPAFVIGARPPFEVEEERMPSSLHLLEEVDRYNRIEVPHTPGDATRLLPPDGSVPEDERAFSPFLAWADPPFRRADAIADRFRSRFLAISRLMFLMSALAAFSVAVSVASEDPDVRRTFASLEVAFMAAALILWLLVRRRLHGRWITSRFLAERLRAATFLAFVGSGRVMESRPEGEYRGNPQEWLSRVFREIWRSRPRYHPDGDVEQAKRLLGLAWVGPQAAYYRRRSRGHASAFVFLTAASAVMFLTAVVAAALHASELFDGSLSEVVAILSIGLPALAGALTGIAALEQHRRHADHFGLMARRLTELGDDLQRAADLERVRDLASRIEAELRTEANAWIDVMRFQDVDFPAR